MTIRSMVNSGEKYLHIAKTNNVSAALVRKVYLFGVDSKKLRKAMDIIGPPRHRLNIDCPPELKARFEQTRGEMSRPDFLEGLLDLLDGVGKLRY